MLYQVNPLKHSLIKEDFILLCPQIPTKNVSSYCGTLKTERDFIS